MIHEHSLLYVSKLLPTNQRFRLYFDRDYELDLNSLLLIKSYHPSFVNNLTGLITQILRGSRPILTFVNFTPNHYFSWKSNHHLHQNYSIQVRLVFHDLKEFLFIATICLYMNLVVLSPYILMNFLKLSIQLPFS